MVFGMPVSPGIQIKTIDTASAVQGFCCCFTGSKKQGVSMTREIISGNVKIGGNRPLVLIAGPCVIEDEAATLRHAERLMTICNGLSMSLVFKASYDKANRTSINAYRGPGLREGLAILRKVKESLGVSVISDIHSIEQVAPAAEVLDIIQIPAFLCRQTDLLVAAAKSGRIINVKKGQFLAPWDMKNVAGKISASGNENIILTERGASFGYNNLVVDMRSFPVMRATGYPVVFDATHSVQLPGGQGDSSGGQREFVEYLSRAAVATGIDGIFMEVHEDPDKAFCDGPNSISLSDLPALLKTLKTIDFVIKQRPTA
jgi:2-dehydro-3-deoxyphosphooctonate aldolase (KDO 8-P synthase)